MNYLFFRTDRVGDLLVSSILLKSVKRINPKNKVFVVCSEFNSDFAKNLSFIDDVFILKKGFFNKLKLFIKINLLKIDKILILDGKDRSILFSFFILAKDKIYILNKKKFSIFFKTRQEKLIFDNEKSDTKINIIKKIQNKIGISFLLNDTNIFKNEIFLHKINKNKLNFLTNNSYNLLHFDEKWVKNLYIKSYKNIELDFKNLNLFINSIINKSKMNLIVTSGKDSTKTLDQLKSSMDHINDAIYVKKINNFFLYYVEQPNFYELIEIIRKSKLCVTCHGAPTHISSIFNVRTIDIIDDSKILLYRAYTSHLNKYNEVIRINSDVTTRKILSLF